MRWSEYEREIFRLGCRLIAGVDEAGRGAIAGPVVVGVVMLSDLSSPWFDDVKDSKLLSPKRREKIFEHLIKECWTGIGLATPSEIDKLRISRAVSLAFGRALEKLYPKPQFLLLDARILPPDDSIPYKSIIKGDRLCLSIACASILAKVTRDRIMEEQEKIYPGYDFAQNKGYATRKHLELLSRLCPSPIHRLSFAPLSR